eukprot:220304_1
MVLRWSKWLSSCFQSIQMAHNILTCQKYCHSNTFAIPNLHVSHLSDCILSTFWIHLIRLFTPIYNQTKTTIINTKSVNISMEHANTKIVIFTDDKSMIWIHIKDLNYTLNNIVKFAIAPEKHLQQKQLIYHLLLLQISKLYLIYLKHYQLQLFVLLKVFVLFILLMTIYNLFKGLIYTVLCGN